MTESRPTWMSHVTSQIWEASDPRHIKSSVSLKEWEEVRLVFVCTCVFVCECVKYMNTLHITYIKSSVSLKEWEEVRIVFVCTCVFVRECVYYRIRTYIECLNHPCPWKYGRKCVFYVCVRVCLHVIVYNLEVVHISHIWNCGRKCSLYVCVCVYMCVCTWLCIP